jgi:hypothetical protein
VTSATPTRFSARWWVEDRRGRLALASWPNPALTVWLVSLVVGWTDVLGTERAATLSLVGKGALVVWGLDELVRGASPVRRILGALVLVTQLVRLFG